MDARIGATLIARLIGYQYVGCYRDKYEPNRALELLAYKDEKNGSGVNSNGRCIRECSRLGFTFAGTEARNECFCGNNYDYDRHGERQNDCSSACQNNNNETCGGSWRIQIYSVCPTGKYKGAGGVLTDNKPNCGNECHCRALPCLYLNGTCTDGCAIGWRGDACNERDCDVGNGGCEHLCNKRRTNEWCSCDQGFLISHDDRTKQKVTTKPTSGLMFLGFHAFDISTGDSEALISD
ncbi:hypothetical protein CAPTEDRAFT_198510 [Capitella teleta]|uniref:WSC domain-containing protein n=1 Tax=Capitella teleta TaxID=283909 RepID=R7ULN1_CAPTE|nr:hypothetical protein CAPTEDRAFT_198510 [Capitella teleta]|eukprot:ELU04847.1 hypothetical protein CAPTEDRAFT_198510 [Capitella teleta]